MDTTCQENIWEIYGLKNNPFSTSPILVNEGFIPLEAFVGREEEIKSYFEAIKEGKESPIPAEELFEVTRVSFEI